MTVEPTKERRVNHKDWAPFNFSLLNHCDSRSGSHVNPLSDQHLSQVTEVNIPKKVPKTGQILQTLVFLSSFLPKLEGWRLAVWGLGGARLCREWKGIFANTRHSTILASNRLCTLLKTKENTSPNLTHHSGHCAQSCLAAALTNGLHGTVSNRILSGPALVCRWHSQNSGGLNRDDRQEVIELKIKPRSPVPISISSAAPLPWV